MGDSFSLDNFDYALENIARMLGELWAIDQALGTNPDKSEGTFAGVATPMVQVNLGRTYPFEERIAAPGLTAGTSGYGGQMYAEQQAIGDEFWDGLYDQGQSLAQAEIGAIRSTLNDIVKARASEFDKAEQQIRHGVIDPLQTVVSDDFAMLDKSIGDWEGNAADNFADFFYNKMLTSVLNQAYVAEAICLLLASSKAIVNLGQHSLEGAVESMQKVLDEQLKQRQSAHQPGGTSTSEWLAIGALFVGVIAAIPTGGTSLTLVAAGISMAAATNEMLSYASGAVAAEEAEPMVIEAVYSSDALDQFSDNVRTIVKRVDQHWEEVRGQQSTPLETSLGDMVADRLLHPQRPNLADGVHPGGFYHESKHY